MNIGGLLPFSLNDFPGRVAAVVFTQGCGFRCPFCHNGDLIPRLGDPANRLSEEDVLTFLDKRRRRLDGIVVSGGEPALQPDLLDFLRKIRRLDYAVKLDTNGARPDVVQRVIDEKLVDFIAMDVKAPLDRYDDLAGVRIDAAKIVESIRLIASSSIARQFRTTVVPQLLDDEDVARIRRLLPDGEELRLQTFQPEYALDPALRTLVAEDAPAAALAG